MHDPAGQDGCGLVWSYTEGKENMLGVSAEVGLAGLPGGLDSEWATVGMGSDTTLHLARRGLENSADPVPSPPLPRAGPSSWGLTCSRSAVLRSLYTNSPTATSTDRTSPAARTMKMPPIFWMPRALASLFSSSGHPLPRHHFSFRTCSLSSSCSCRMAMVILSRYGEPERGREEPGCQQPSVHLCAPVSTLVGARHHCWASQYAHPKGDPSARRPL